MNSSSRTRGQQVCPQLRGIDLEQLGDRVDQHPDRRGRRRTRRRARRARDPRRTTARTRRPGAARSRSGPPGPGRWCRASVTSGATTRTDAASAASSSAASRSCAASASARCAPRLSPASACGSALVAGERRRSGNRTTQQHVAEADRGHTPRAAKSSSHASTRRANPGVPGSVPPSRIHSSRVRQRIEALALDDPGVQRHRRCLDPRAHPVEPGRAAAGLPVAEQLRDSAGREVLADAARRTRRRDRRRPCRRRGTRTREPPRRAG